jgi:hypothetical protein
VEPLVAKELREGSRQRAEVLDEASIVFDEAKEATQAMCRG